MKRTILTTKEFCLRIEKKYIMPAVIAGITFFFSPVQVCNTASFTSFQEPSIELSEKDVTPNSDCNIAQIFDKTFKERCRDLDAAYPIFKEMLPIVCSLPIEEGYADYGNKSGNIHFNMFLKDNLRLTIDRNISEKDDKVTFSLSLANDMLALDELSLHDVINIVEKLLS